MREQSGTDCHAHGGKCGGSRGASAVRSGSCGRDARPTRSLTQLAGRKFGIILHARYCMQKIISLLAPLVLALVSAGCAGMAASSQLPESLSSLNPNTTALEIHNQTQVKLTEGNFAVVKTNVVGEARGFALLGFITFVPARFQTAMDRLYSKAEMR